MKAEIIERKENKIFEREEIKVHLRHPGSATPTIPSVQGFMAKVLNTTPSHVEVLKVEGLKGVEASVADIIFWKNKEVEDLTKPKEEKKEETKTEGEQENKQENAKSEQETEKEGDGKETKKVEGENNG